MKILNTIYSSFNELQQKLDLNGLEPQKTLVQIFSGFVTESEIKQIQSIFKEKNNAIRFIGTTTSGEIFNGESYEHSIVVSILEFETTEVHYGTFVDNNDYDTGRKIAQTLFTNQTKAAILFSTSFTINGCDLINGISSENPTIPIAGALAGDNYLFNSTFIFDNNGIYSKGAIVAVLNSDKLQVSTEYYLNWKAIGPIMTITNADKNRLFEVNNKNITSIYTEYLGEAIGNNLPLSATEFPLISVQNEIEICHSFVHQFTDGSLQSINNFNIGDKVRFAFGDIDLIIKDINSYVEKYYNNNTEAIFLYSCAARKNLLQSNVNKELKPINQLAPNCGFFGYGEFFHKKPKNLLLTESLTLLLLKENDLISSNKKQNNNDINIYKKENFLKEKNFLILYALTHLSNKIIKELEENNKKLYESEKKLREEANRDYLTNLYNRRYFNEIANMYFKNSKRSKNPISTIVLDIDNFKQINDTYGHAVGDKVLIDLSDLLIKNVRDCDLVSRSGGEEFSILLPFATKKDAIKIAERIRSSVENHIIDIKDTKINFTISIGVDEVDIKNDFNILQTLERADEKLYIAKNNGKNKVISD